MGLFGSLKKLFKKDTSEQVIQDEGSVLNTSEQTVINVLKKEEAKLDDIKLRKKATIEDVKRYIDANGLKIRTAEDQNDKLKNEYGQVTEYLSDIQIIDSISGDDRENLIDYASTITKLEKERRSYLKHDAKINNSEYKIMEQYADIMNAELINMKKKEKYQSDIKHDMKHLEGEKAMLFFEQEECFERQAFIKKVSMLSIILVISIFVALSVIWIFSDADMTMPFIIAIAFGGVLVYYISTRSRTNRFNALLVEKKLNKAIMLLNSVKIKYINNTALLDYICSKYNVKNSKQLEFIWNEYIKLKSIEEKMSENAEALENAKNDLEALLKDYQVKDASVWIVQAAALLDNKEMVEVRHKLNVRRNKLREHIAYNDEQIRNGAEMIRKVLKTRPQLRDIVGNVLRKYNIDKLVLNALRR